MSHDQSVVRNLPSNLHSTFRSILVRALSAIRVDDCDSRASSPFLDLAPRPIPCLTPCPGRTRFIIWLH